MRFKKMSSGILLSQEFFADLVDVAGAHGDQEVAWLAVFQKKIFDFVEGREVFTWSTEFDDFFLQISGRNAKIIRFTCSIDISQYDVICKGKSFGKFRKKGFGTCISMRLEYTTRSSYVDNFWLREGWLQSLSDDAHNHQ